MSEAPLRFAGPVTCARGSGALRLTLVGIAADPPAQPLTVGFAAAAPAGLPALLQDAVVEETAGGFRIASAAGAWTLAVPAAHVHRDVSVAFYRALPPRPVPLGKRVFWRLVLLLAASRSGMALLRALRGRS
jgi:hypothetical protein